MVKLPFITMCPVMCEFFRSALISGVSSSLSKSSIHPSIPTYATYTWLTAAASAFNTVSGVGKAIFFVDKYGLHSTMNSYWGYNKYTSYAPDLY